jgi:hypothetical protein
VVILVDGIIEEMVSAVVELRGEDGGRDRGLFDILRLYVEMCPSGEVVRFGFAWFVTSDGV